MVLYLFQNICDKKKSTFKGTVTVISSDPPCKDSHVRFTTVPFKPLTNHRGQRSPCLYLLNIVLIPVNPDCTLAYRMNSTQLTLLVPC